MKSTFKNIFLIVALSAVIIMIIGIALYDYIPTSVTVAKSNIYEVDEKTTKVLSEVATLTQNTSIENDDSNNVVLQTYSVTKADLAVYQSDGAFQKGKANPLKKQEEPKDTGNTDDNEINTNSNNSTSQQGSTNTASSSNSNTNSKTQVSDGTMFNSKSSK